MNNTDTDRRKDTVTRDIFKAVIIDICDILSCYDREYQRQIFYKYMDVYGIFKDNDCIKGRILSRIREGNFLL